jgi:hypothetical protein
LAHSIDSLGSWLVILTLVVALGLVIEYTKHIKNFLVSSFKWVFSGQERPSLTTEVIGGLLITIGVAGEGGVEFRLSTLETSLRKVNDAAFTNLSTLAKTAQKSADKSADAAKQAIGSAQQANDQAGTAKARAEDVGKQTAELRKKNLGLAQQLATVEKAAFPRHLRQKEFSEYVKPFKGFPVIIETISDFEARRTASLIYTGIHMAEWQVAPVAVRVDPLSVVDFFFPGVMIDENCGPDPALDWRSPPEEAKKSNELWGACTKAYESLLDGLNENGIEARGQGFDMRNRPRNIILVRVSLKPMPGQPREKLISGP